MRLAHIEQSGIIHAAAGTIPAVGRLGFGRLNIQQPRAGLPPCSIGEAPARGNMNDDGEELLSYAETMARLTHDYRRVHKVTIPGHLKLRAMHGAVLSGELIPQGPKAITDCLQDSLYAVGGLNPSLMEAINAAISFRKSEIDLIWPDPDESSQTRSSDTEEVKRKLGGKPVKEPTVKALGYVAGMIAERGQRSVPALPDEAAKYLVDKVQDYGGTLDQRQAKKYAESLLEGYQDQLNEE